MQIVKLSSNRFSSNTFLLYFYDTLVIIDPQADNIGELVFDDFKAIHCFLTHEHVDHISGLEPLSRCHNLSVYATEVCSSRIADARQNLSYYAGEPYAYKGGVKVFSGSKEHEIEGNRIICYELPGHSPGSCVIKIRGALFTGDLIIKDIKTVTKVPGGDKKMLAESLGFLFSHFSGDTLCYPGHGDEFVLNTHRIYAGKRDTMEVPGQALDVEIGITGG